jgi:hypothetical protein
MQSLEKQLASQVLALETRVPLHADTLLQIDEIDAIDTLTDHRVRLHFSGNNPADKVAASVATHGWGLVELALERQTLEQVFVDLTCSDRKPGDEEAA